MESVSLMDLAAELVELARGATSGRAAHTVHGGSGHTLRQTVLALLAGHALAEHESPGEATLQILSGHVRFTAGEHVWDGETGDLLVIGPERHALTAITDAVVLLTVSQPMDHPAPDAPHAP